eukprot:Clim_evm29s55 gene=Clim_evmTU29s55
MSEKQSGSILDLPSIELSDGAEEVTEPVPAHQGPEDRDTPLPAVNTKLAKGLHARFASASATNSPRLQRRELAQQQSQISRDASPGQPAATAGRIRSGQTKSVVTTGAASNRRTRKAVGAIYDENEEADVYDFISDFRRYRETMTAMSQLHLRKVTDGLRGSFGQGSCQDTVTQHSEEDALLRPMDSLRATHPEGENATEPFDIVRVWSKEKGVEKFDSLEDFVMRFDMHFLADTEYCAWIDIYNPSDSMLQMAHRVFGLHSLSLEDITELEDREKLELFDRYAFICWDFLMQGQGSHLEYSPIYLAVYHRIILTFHDEDIPFYNSTVARLQASKTTFRSDWVMYCLMDEMIDVYIPQVEAIEAEILAIDDLVLIISEGEQGDMLRRIGGGRNRLAQARRLLGPKKEILTVLSGPGRQFKLGDLTKQYLRDVLDDIISMLEDIHGSKDTLGTAQDAYYSMVSIEVARSSRKLNVMVGRLTIGASVLLPLNLVSQIFGMNVTVPFQTDKVDSVGPFFVIIGFMGLIMVALVWAAKRNGMLND